VIGSFTNFKFVNRHLLSKYKKTYEYTPLVLYHLFLYSNATKHFNLHQSKNKVRKRKVAQSGNLPKEIKGPLVVNRPKINKCTAAGLYLDDIPKGKTVEIIFCNFYIDLFLNSEENI